MIPVRNARQGVCLFLAGIMLFTGIHAAARANPDKTADIPFTATAPETAVPGETVPVLLHSPSRIKDTILTLYSSDNTPLFMATTFPLGGSKKDGYRSGALLPLNSLIAPGEYRISVPTGGEPLSLALHVENRVFIAETIPLTERNTAIKTDTGKKRMEQIRKLTEILLTRSNDAPVFTGPFILPVQATRRTSGYGDRRLYRFSDGGSQRNIHYGIDFGIPSGTPVFSSGDGRIVLAEFRVTTGWTVVVEHLPGVYSLYYHLDKLDTRKGETVRAGTLIGKSGCTGLSTGPHLHWEFRVNGEPVDPDWFVDRILF